MVDVKLKFLQNISHYCNNIFAFHMDMFTIFVRTLALGSQPRQRLVKVRAKSEAQESHFMLLGMCENVRK
jgi:hypothetical protein